MLVLSRKESDRIVFPTLGITVEVLRIQGNTTRIGIDAPADVPVFRHEIADLNSFAFTSDEDPTQQVRRLVHAVRGRLDVASELLNAIHQHLDGSGNEAAQELIVGVFNELRVLDREASEAVDTPDKCLARALLVEDDANERGLLASYLQLRGIETTTAADGQDAIDFLSLHAAPDVVLLDMNMPRCDGRRLVTTLRADRSMQSVKLIAVSGTDPQTLGVPYGPRGIDRWFPKPVDPERLIDGIAAELGIATTAV